MECLWLGLQCDTMIDIEIIFISSSTPKKIKATSVYTKAGLLCVEMIPDEQGRVLILKYPLSNIFQVAHYHGEHLGSCKSLPIK